MPSNYNNAAWFYDCLSRLVYGKALVNAQNAFLHLIPANTKILIAGGGTGRLIIDLATIYPAGLNITYVEISAKMLALSKKRDGGKNVISYINAPVQEFNAVCDFDVLITPFLLDNFTPQNFNDLFDHLRHLLKPGGLWLNTDFQLTGKWWQKPLLKTMYTFFTILGCMETSGLPPIKERFKLMGCEVIDEKPFLAILWFRRLILKNKYFIIFDITNLPLYQAHYMKRLLLSFISLLCFEYVNAQTAPTLPAKSDFKLFFEKTYLHTDREYYAAGDDIWFKAYLTDARTNRLLSSSYNLYVELISPNSAIIDRKMIRLDNGMGNGDFKLGDSLLTGTYRLRAYTNWMLNFGDNFIFEKQLHIYSDIRAVALPMLPLTAKPYKGKSKPALPTAISIKTDSPIAYAKVSFFPESGSMIEGTAGVVAFKAEDANGKGMPVKGAIYTTEGNKVTDIENNRYGLGSFVLLPQAGINYEARGNFSNNKPFSVQLPRALLKGFAFNTRYADSVIKVIVNTNALTLYDLGNTAFKIQGLSKGQVLFSVPVVIKDLQTLVSVPKNILPPGITTITLIDAAGKPQCERLLFNDDAEKASISITTDEAVYTPKSKVTAHIKIAGRNGLALKSQLSVAAVDARLIPPDEGNIFSYLYLQSEIKGAIENAAQYFDEGNPLRGQQLDLLLLTQGWRDFVWKRLADSTLRISYELEQGITVSGRVQGIWGSKGEPDMNVTLYADDAKGDKLFTTPTDLKGQYAFYGLNLTGSQQVVLSSVNAKGKKGGYVLIDTILKKPYPVRPVSGIVDSADAVKFKDAVIGRSALEKKYHATPLSEVRIIAQPLRIIKTITDTTINMARNDYKLETLAEYIAEKVPGFMLSADHRRAYTLLWGRPAAPVITVDSLIPYGQIRRVRRYIWDIPLEKIIDIRYRHVIIHENLSWQQQEWGFTNKPDNIKPTGHNLWIELKLKPHALDEFDFHTSHYDVDGYYEARTFFAPKYEGETTQPDYRTTIHWAPVVNAEPGEAVISWYNADPKTKVRIVAEGLTDKGLPVFGTATYEVK